MYYQIDYGNGYENVYPDGHGLHLQPCDDPECAGCWSPEQGDPETWLDQVKADGIASRARVLIGGNTLVKRTFTGEAGQTLAADVDFQRWAHEALDAQDADARERRETPEGRPWPDGAV